MALKDFIWFDRAATQTGDPNQQQEDSGYTPYRKGALSILGQSLSGIGAAFAGDTQWLQRQQKIDQEQYQSDLEFRAKLLQLRAAEKENMSQQKLRDAQTGLYQAQADMINDPSKMMNYMSMMSGDQSQMTAPLTEQEPAKTLADAIPVRQEQFITKKIMTSSGKPAVSQMVNPEFQKELERKNTAVKDLGQFFDKTEKLSVVLDELERTIDNIPKNYRSENFKLGPLNKVAGSLAMKKADWSNEKWFRDYQQSLNNSFMPVAQSEDLGKVFSDLDLTTQIKSLGDEGSPFDTKKRAIEIIRKKINNSTTSRLKALGADEQTIASIYPNTAKSFSLGQYKDPKYKAAVDAGYTPEEIAAYLKGRK